MELKYGSWQPETEVWALLIAPLMELKCISLAQDIYDGALLIAPLMELKLRYSHTAYRAQTVLLIAPLMELKLSSFCSWSAV